MPDDATNPIEPVPDTGRGDSLTVDKQTLGLLRRAANEHRRGRTWWPTDEAALAAGVRVVKAAMESPDLNLALNGAKTLVAMNGQNQADEHLAEKHKRLDEGKGTDGTQITVVHVERPVAGNEVP